MKEIKQTIVDLVAGGASERDVAKHFGWVPSKAHRMFVKFGIKANYPKQIKHRCLCGQTDPDEFFGHRKSTCKKCHVKNQVSRWNSYKRQAVSYKGGRCEMCGYNRCDASLAFHHLGAKDPEWKLIRNRCFENWKKEIDGCMLLCHNCHNELHFAISKGAVIDKKSSAKEIQKKVVDFLSEYAIILSAG